MAYKPMLKSSALSACALLLIVASIYESRTFHYFWHARIAVAICAFFIAFSILRKASSKKLFQNVLIPLVILTLSTGYCYSVKPVVSVTSNNNLNKCVVVIENQEILLPKVDGSISFKSNDTVFLQLNDYFEFNSLPFGKVEMKIGSHSIDFQKGRYLKINGADHTTEFSSSYNILPNEAIVINETP